MAALAGRVQRFPAVVKVTFGTRHFPVVLVKHIAGHGIVIKAHMFAFPASLAMTHCAVQAQGSFVGIVAPMAGNAFVLGLHGFANHRDAGSFVASPALNQQVFTGKVLSAA